MSEFKVGDKVLAYVSYIDAMEGIIIKIDEDKDMVWVRDTDTGELWKGSPSNLEECE